MHQLAEQRNGRLSLPAEGGETQRTHVLRSIRCEEVQIMQSSPAAMPRSSSGTRLLSFFFDSTSTGSNKPSGVVRGEMSPLALHTTWSANGTPVSAGRKPRKAASASSRMTARKRGSAASSAPSVTWPISPSSSPEAATESQASPSTTPTAQHSHGVRLKLSPSGRASAGGTAIDGHGDNESDEDVEVLPSPRVALSPPARDHACSSVTSFRSSATSSRAVSPSALLRDMFGGKKGEEEAVSLVREVVPVEDEEIAGATTHERNENERQELLLSSGAARRGKRPAGEMEDEEHRMVKRRKKVGDGSSEAAASAATDGRVPKIQLAPPESAPACATTKEAVTRHHDKGRTEEIEKPSDGHVDAANERREQLREGVKTSDTQGKTSAKNDSAPQPPAPGSGGARADKGGDSSQQSGSNEHESAADENVEDCHQVRRTRRRRLVRGLNDQQQAPARQRQGAPPRTAAAGGASNAVRKKRAAPRRPPTAATETPESSSDDGNTSDDSVSSNDCNEHSGSLQSTMVPWVWIEVALEVDVGAEIFPRTSVPLWPSSMFTISRGAWNDPVKSAPEVWAVMDPPPGAPSAKTIEPELGGVHVDDGRHYGPKVHIQVDYPALGKVSVFAEREAKSASATGRLPAGQTRLSQSGWRPPQPEHGEAPTANVLRPQFDWESPKSASVSPTSRLPPLLSVESKRADEGTASSCSRGYPESFASPPTAQSFISLSISPEGVPAEVEKSSLSRSEADTTSKSPVEDSSGGDGFLDSLGETETVGGPSSPIAVESDEEIEDEEQFLRQSADSQQAAEAGPSPRAPRDDRKATDGDGEIRLLTKTTTTATALRSGCTGSLSLGSTTAEGSTRSSSASTPPRSGGETASPGSGGKGADRVAKGGETSKRNVEERIVDCKKLIAQHGDCLYIPHACRIFFHLAQPYQASTREEVMAISSSRNPQLLRWGGKGPHVDEIPAEEAQLIESAASISPALHKLALLGSVIKHSFLEAEKAVVSSVMPGDRWGFAFDEGDPFLQRVMRRRLGNFLRLRRGEASQSEVPADKEILAMCLRRTLASLEFDMKYNNKSSEGQPSGRPPSRPSTADGPDADGPTARKGDGLYAGGGRKSLTWTPRAGAGHRRAVERCVTSMAPRVLKGGSMKGQLGMFATERIPAGTFLGPFLGVIYRREKYDELCRRGLPFFRYYVQRFSFDMDDLEADEEEKEDEAEGAPKSAGETAKCKTIRLVVDPLHHGNRMMLINDFCETPFDKAARNSEEQRNRINAAFDEVEVADIRWPGVTTIKDIEKDTEILMDYGETYFGHPRAACSFDTLSMLSGFIRQLNNS